MSAGQVVGVLIAVVAALVITTVIAVVRARRKRRARQHNVRTWSKSDKWQPWR